MRILRVFVIGCLSRQIVRGHATRRQGPTLTTIMRLPHTAARHRYRQMSGITRVHQHRMHAGVIVTAAKPALSPGLFPQGLVQRPSLAAILRLEQPCRHATGPQGAWLIRTAGCQRPDQVHVPRRGVICPKAMFRFQRKSRGTHLFPGRAPIQALAQLHTEMPHAQRGVPGAIARVRQRLRHGFARKVVRFDGPLRAATANHEQPFSTGNQQCFHVDFSPFLRMASHP